MTSEILNIKDVAKLQRAAEETMYSRTQTVDLPALKVRGQWRPRLADRGAWITTQRRATCPKRK